MNHQTEWRLKQRIDKLAVTTKKNWHKLACTFNCAQPTWAQNCMHSVTNDALVIRTKYANQFGGNRGAESTRLLYVHIPGKLTHSPRQKTRNILFVAPLWEWILFFLPNSALLFIFSNILNQTTIKTHQTKCYLNLVPLDYNAIWVRVF